MTCPQCNALMQEVTKTGVFIDLCPECKGVWLERGELEKILARVRAAEREWEEEQARCETRGRDYPQPERYDRRYPGEGRYRKKRWTEIFDIFD